MKKVTLLALLALLVPWLTQSKTYVAKEFTATRNPQVQQLIPGANVSGSASLRAYGGANGRVSGETKED